MYRIPSGLPSLHRRAANSVAGEIGYHRPIDEIAGNPERARRAAATAVVPKQAKQHPKCRIDEVSPFSRSLFPPSNPTLLIHDDVPPRGYAPGDFRTDPPPYSPRDIIAVKHEGHNPARMKKGGAPENQNPRFSTRDRLRSAVSGAIAHPLAFALTGSESGSE